MSSSSGEWAAWGCCPPLQRRRLVATARRSQSDALVLPLLLPLLLLLTHTIIFPLAVLAPVQPATLRAAGAVCSTRRASPKCHLSPPRFCTSAPPPYHSHSPRRCPHHCASRRTGTGEMPVPVSATHPKGAGLQAATLQTALPSEGPWARLGGGSTPAASQRQQKGGSAAATPAATEHPPAAAAQGGGEAAVATHHLSFSYPDIGEAAQAGCGALCGQRWCCGLGPTGSTRRPASRPPPLPLSRWPPPARPRTSGPRHEHLPAARRGLPADRPQRRGQDDAAEGERGGWML